MTLILTLKQLNPNNSVHFFYFILSDKPYLISRVGNVEINACRGKHLTKFPSSEPIPTLNTIDQYIRKNAGFYFKNQTNHLTCREIFYIWQQKYINCIFKSDIVLVYKHHLKDFEIVFQKETNVIDKLKYEVFFEDLEFYLLLLEYYTTILDKKILIISHFTDTMKKQLDKLHLIFPNFKIKKTNIIFYKSFQSIEGNYPHNNWLETFQIMIDDISKINFDISFMGCGCYGLPIAHYIHKEMKKSALYIGGIVQLLFAIKGRRWDIRSNFSSHFLFKKINDYWIFPAEHEKPLNYKNVEEGCYW